MLLVPVGVDGLPEVPASIEEADADHGKGHVRGGLHVIAGQDPEASGVEGEALVPAELGAEIGDRIRELGAVRAREPVVAAARHVVVEGSDDLVDLGQEPWVLEKGLPVDGAGTDGYGIPSGDPAAWMDASEERSRLRVP